MSTPILATKLYVPPPRSQAVLRSRLVERLNEGLHRRLTLISAPAGFGKTTLLGEWIAGGNQPAVWLNLDEGDSDPVRFLTYLVAALQKLALSGVEGSAPNIGDGVLNALEAPQPPPAEWLLTTLLNEITTLPDNFILVLDDYHLVDSRPVDDALSFLLEHQPPQMHLVIATREDPHLPLARLRVRGELAELRAADLRFTPFEAADFLNRVMGLSLSAEDIASLETRTEGWIAGLQLAAISMQGHKDTTGFIKSFTGSHHFVLDYLLAEVLQRQSKSVQHFLLRTSILNRLCGSLCDAILLDSSGQATLEHLERANLFIVPLDQERRWYRYHHLFADLLAYRLKQTLKPSEIQKLHSQASAWLEQNDLLEEAIHHALLGKDDERAILMVERVARTMMFAGRVNDLRNWLEALPQAPVGDHLYLRIYRTWIDLLQGRIDLSEPALLKMETMLRALPPSPENDTLLKEMIVILSHWVALAGNTSRAIHLAQEALGFLPEGDEAARARVFSALAIAYGSEGNVEKADAAFRECLRLAQASANYSLAAHTMMRAGIWLGYYGKLHQAASMYQSIIDMGVQAGQKIFYPSGQGLIGLSGIYLEWNELESAEKALQQGMELCIQAGLDGVFTGYVFKSRLRQAKGDLAGALEELQELERALPKSDTFSLTIRKIQVRLAMGDTDAASHLALPFVSLLGSHAEHALERPPVVVVEIVEAILIRVYLALSEFEKALDLLDRLQATAEPGGRFGHLIEMHLLRSLALQKQNRGEVPAKAIESLGRALALAEAEGYVLLFAEAGPDVVPLLRGVIKLPAAPDSVKKYARKLLRIVSKEDKSTGSPIETSEPANEMIEPLTDRELDVLRLIADGLKYAEIAGKLFISLNTVRTHVKGIYGKLDVNNRSEAIALAHRYRLI